MPLLPEDPYFELRQLRQVTVGTLLKGGIVIVRKDTGDIVARVTRYGQDSDDLARQLHDAVHERLTGLGRPSEPDNDPTVSQLLALYLKNRDALYGIELKAEAAHSREEAARIRADATQQAATLNSEVTARVAMLTPAQRLELTAASDDELARSDEGQMLDILTARRDLADMLPAPSPEEIANLDRLQKYLSDEADMPGSVRAG